MALKPLKKLQALKPLLPKEFPPSSLGESEGEHPEGAAKADHIKMMKGLRQQQQEANELANDAGYWFAAYFQTAQQKDEFLDALKLETGGQYVDGLDLAERLGVKLTPRTVKYKTGQIDKKCSALAR